MHLLSMLKYHVRNEAIRLGKSRIFVKLFVKVLLKFTFNIFNLYV